MNNKTLFLSACLLSLGSIASATLLVYDGFEAGGATPGAGQYETGTGYSGDSLKDQNPNTLGFSGAWTSTGSAGTFAASTYPRANATGLGYSDLNGLEVQTQTGSAEIFRSGTGTGKTIDRALDGTSFDAGSNLYVSGLFNFAAGSPGQILITTTWNNGSTGGTRDTFLGFNSSGQLLAESEGVGSDSGATTYAASTTYFVVAEFQSDANSANRNINIWVNPGDLTNLGGPTHTWLGSFYSEVTAPTITDFSFTTLEGSHENPSFILDEIRIGSTLDSVVVAIPEPGTLAMMGIALGSLLLFRRRS